MTAGLLLLPFPALAQYPGGGSYSAPTYSGGTVTIAYPSGPASFNYSLNSQDNTWGGRYYASGYADSSISVTCSDPIGTTFNWQPASGQTVTTDPPPACVILTEYCQTHWYGSTNNGTVTGGCSNPMGGSAVPYSPPPGSFWEATKYSVITNPPPTLSISSSPSATATSAASNSAGTGVASVSYSAAVSPVTVTLSVYQALAGQQITATLNGVSSSWVKSYTWSFSGGTGANPIKNWDPNGMAADGVTPQQLFPLTSADLTGTDTTGNGISVAPINFYDQATDSITVTCTVSLNFPDGTTGTVNAQSMPVEFVKPSANWSTNQTLSDTGAYFDQSGMGAIEKWDASITVPPPFSGGTGCFAQVVTPTIQFQRNPQNNQPSLCYLEEPQQNADGTTTYVLPSTGLDNFFPYQIGPSTDPNSPNPFQTYDAGYQWDVSSTGHSVDTPFVPFNIGASDNGGNDWYAGYATEIFTTWLMYKPSSGGTGTPIWVPLQRVDWHWTGNVVKDRATGLWHSAVNGNPPVTASSSDPGLTTDTPPQWTTVNVGGPLRP